MRIQSVLSKTGLTAFVVALLLLSTAMLADAMPFQFQAELALADGQHGGAEALIPVPPGMRLLIETVTAHVTTVGVLRGVRVFIETVLDGQTVQHEVALTRVLDTNVDVWTATHGVRLYTDAGLGREAGPRIVAARAFIQPAGSLTARVTISGRLVAE